MALKIYFLHSKDNDEGQKRRLCREQKKVAINEKKRRIIISSPNQKNHRQRSFNQKNVDKYSFDFIDFYTVSTKLIQKLNPCLTEFL